MLSDELVQRLVLDKICDDYENLDSTILRDVAKDALELGEVVGREQIVEALSSLIAAGLAKAYCLSATGSPVTEIELPSAAEIQEGDEAAYFLATPKGVELQLADDTWWPGPKQ